MASEALESYNSPSTIILELYPNQDSPTNSGEEAKKGDGYERERPRSNGISWEVFRDVGKNRAKSWEGPKGSSASQGLPQGKFGNFCGARIGRICLDFGSSTGWGTPRVDAPGVEDLP